MIDLKRQEALREAVELMYFSYRTFTDGPDKILHKRGLNRAHHRILYFIGREPDLSVARLLELLQISKQALNTPLRQLQAMKLVSSVHAPHDKRIRQLRLTTTGRKLEQRLTGTQLNQLEDIFTAAGVDAEAGWRTVMSIFSEN